MHLLALILAAAPLSYPEVLTRPVLAKVERFQWPAPDVFKEGWARRDAAGFQVYRGVVRGKNGLEKTGYFKVSEGYGGMYVVALALDGATRDDAEHWKLSDPVSLEAVRWQLDDEAQLEVTERLPNTVSDADLVPWTYVSTLVGPKEEPRESQRLGWTEGDSELDSAMRLEGTELSKWLEAHKGDDALYARAMAYSPMGRCSMDNRPASVARLKAELAYARGDLANFLKRQVNIMGDQFSRVAYSSYGERAHDTQAERLLTTGVDFEKFMLGLLIVRPNSVAALDVWRWARSVGEAGKIAPMREAVRKLAEASDSDPYTRLRATQAHAYLGMLESAKRSKGSNLIAFAQTQKLKLHPLAATWLRGQVGEDL
jgi:hypothetical protein